MGQLVFDLHLHLNTLVGAVPDRYGKLQNIRGYSQGSKTNTMTTGLHFILKGDQGIGKNITPLSYGVVAGCTMTFQTGHHFFSVGCYLIFIIGLLVTDSTDTIPPVK